MAKKSEATHKVCFVIGPIGSEGSEDRLEADWLLEEIIEPVMVNHPEFKVQRADKLAQPGLIDAQVINLLLNAELVIADLTSLNPNAFYEIGIRHMAQKPTIHMHQTGQNIPFDVSLYRSISFGRARPADLKAARTALAASVSAVLAEGYEVENPVTNARGRVQLEEHATPGQRVLLEEMESLRERVDAVEKSRDVFMMPFGPPLPPYTPARKPDLSGWTVVMVLNELGRSDDFEANHLRIKLAMNIRSMFHAAPKIRKDGLVFNISTPWGHDEIRQRIDALILGSKIVENYTLTPAP
jgi:hypothetical protein